MSPALLWPFPLSTSVPPSPSPRRRATPGEEASRTPGLLTSQKPKVQAPVSAPSRSVTALGYLAFGESDWSCSGQILVVGVSGSGWGQLLLGKASGGVGEGNVSALGPGSVIGVGGGSGGQGFGAESADGEGGDECLSDLAVLADPSLVSMGSTSPSSQVELASRILATPCIAPNKSLWNAT